MTYRLEDLQAFIAALPEKELKLLATRVEKDRFENKLNLPHGTILSLLRPWLRDVEIERTYDAERTLSRPFEDLLTETDPDPKIIGTISRNSMVPMIDIIMTRKQAEWELLEQAFIEAQRNENSRAQRAYSTKIWELGARALREWRTELGEDPEDIRAAAKKLGGTKRLEDIFEIEAILVIAEAIEEMKRLLPGKPLLLLSDDTIHALKQLYQATQDHNPGHEPYLLFVLIRRLVRPFPILRLLRALSPNLDDLISKDRNLTRIAHIVIEALEQDANEIAQAVRKGRLDDLDIVTKARRFAKIFKGMTHDIGIRREGEWGQHMYACRSIVGDAVETAILAAASDIILAALPKAGQGTPDFRSVPDEEKFLAADNRAFALVEINLIASDIGLESACTKRINSLRKDFDHYSAKLLERLGKATEPQKPQAEAHLAMIVRLMELITGADVADLLRRRGNASLTSTTIN